MQLKKYTLILVILTFVLGVMSTYLIKKNPIEIGIFVENFFKQNTIAYNSGDIQTQTGVQFPEAGDTKEGIIIPAVTHIKTPSSVRSLYYTSNAAASKTKIKQLLDFIKNTEINSVTIDIKEIDGHDGFNIPDSDLTTIKSTSKNTIKDIKGLIKELHENGVYVIGRIVVFKDNLLVQNRPDLAIKKPDKTTVWTDYKGNKYLDPYSKEIWDYIVNKSGYAYEIGFDEINYDYVRFPSDGLISQTYYPFTSEIQSEVPKLNKIIAIDRFANYITSKLREKYPDIVLSADIFGLVTLWDLVAIGQNLEVFLLHFDYVGPMVYPSHYSLGHLGFPYPDNAPYAVIKDALKHTNQRIKNLNLEIEQAKQENRKVKIKEGLVSEKDVSTLSEIQPTKIRPWIQGFSCTRCKNYVPYNRERFRQQISAIDDSGLNSWWVWNGSSNYYMDRYNKR